MFCYTVVMLLPLIAVSAPVKSSLQSSGSTTGDISLPASSFGPNQRTADIQSKVRDHVRFFIPPEDSTLPPTVTSVAWKHSSSVEDDYKKGGSSDGKFRASRTRWTNEIVRRGSLTGNGHDEKTENPASETSTTKVTGSKPDIKRTSDENKESFKVDRRSVGEDITKSTQEESTQRDRDERKNSTMQHQPSYNAATTTDAEKSDFDATDEISDEAETAYDYDADYDVADEEYEDDDDDVQYYDDESNQVDEQEVEEYDETRVDEQQSVGREGAHFQEYEISADSSRGLDYDTENAEVVSELQVVERPARRRRRKGRLRTTNKQRNKRRRKRPPVEPVGRVKRPTRTQKQPTRAGASRRKTKARRRRKGQLSNKRKTRKNRRKNQTTSLSFDFGAANGNGNKFEQRYRRPDVGETRKPRLQQSGIIQSLQQRYQQQQQRDGYTGQVSVPRYSDIYAGDGRRRTVAASTDVRGQSSQEEATDRGVHASVAGRVPPVTHHVVQQTRQRAQSTPPQGQTFDLRRYYQLPQHQRPNYYHEQQQQQQQHPVYPRQYYQSFYQHQSPPTFSRHQQQIHFIVPTSDFDVRRIPQVMSALGLNDYISGPRSTADDDDTRLRFLGHQHPPSSSDAYREGHSARPAAQKHVDDKQLESSLSGSGLAPTGDAARRSQRLRYQRSTSVRRRAVNEDDAEASDQRSELQATRSDRSKHLADDVDDDDEEEEYIDNSDIEITTRSYPQTTAVRPF